MVTVYAEGVDYSHTEHGDWNAIAAALKAEGKSFVGRYAVFDKSPDGRGITAPEYRALTDSGLDVFLYYEENEAWMQGGFDAGVRAATRSLQVLSAEGMPVQMPVHYSDDVSPEEDDFDADVDCLRGTASVVGWDRVAFYGGWDAIDHVQRALPQVKFYCQTIAWQYGRGLHPGITLHQYNTGTNMIGGANCDFVAALQPHYGQARDYVTGGSTYARPIPPSLKNGQPYAHFDKDGILWLELIPRRWTALKSTPRKQRANDTAAEVGPPVKKGEKATFVYSLVMPDGTEWFVSKAGSRCRANAFVSEE